MLKSPQVDYVDAAIRYAARTSQPEANNEALYMVNRNKQVSLIFLFNSIKLIRILLRVQ